MKSLLVKLTEAAERFSCNEFTVRWSAVRVYGGFENNLPFCCQFVYLFFNANLHKYFPCILCVFLDY